ncbi:unnamed protein product [Ambrosiozyma monospora]|uniref:Unnamed protein product n=1 Tax=Ambrosiozyma monospora TaxID=43982 RepID=A0A9W6YU66_AMBMO|nr:unnamed protein product [Ambrosiozyma monospora]
MLVEILNFHVCASLFCRNVAAQSFIYAVTSLLLQVQLASTLTSDRSILFQYDQNGGKSLSATGHHRINTVGGGVIKLSDDLHDDQLEIKCQLAPSIACQDGTPFTIISTANLPLKFMIDQTNPNDKPHLLTSSGNRISLVKSPNGLYYIHSHHLIHPSPNIPNLIKYISYTPKPTVAS